MIRYKFSSQLDKEFSRTLVDRVNVYFQENKLSKNANAHMVIKTIAALSIYLVPFTIILFSGIGNVPILFALWMIMGLGKSFIGTSVMHDALHGSYSSKKYVNALMGFSAFVVGVNPAMWKIQHNVLHHTYTNIEGGDEDINPRFVMRFSPHQPRKWFHRYQFIYAGFLYSITTFLWVVIKDFDKLVTYRKEGLVKPGKEFYSHLIVIILQKLLYFTVFLGLPMLILPFSWWLILLMFLAMHAVSGFVLTTVFQLAHVVPTSEFVMQDEEEIAQNRLVHQILTTSNFAMGNKALSWFIGGLNFQIEHHLFPQICHVHYHNIALIVQKTTKEFKLPYHAQKSFFGAIRNHFSMLRTLGRQDSINPI